MSTSMRAAVFRDAKVTFPDDAFLDLVDKPIPVCVGSRDVVIRVLAAGVCQTDLHLIDGHGVAGVTPFAGMALGHESAGVITEIGTAVRDFHVGDHVLCYPFVPTDDASAATSLPPAEGRPRRSPGISHDGGFAEYLLTDERCLVRVPDADACRSLVALTDAGLAAFNGVDSVVRHVGLDRPVVVIGIGGLGHLGVQFARALGVATVMVVEPRAVAREWATDMGFSRIYASVDEARAAVDADGLQVGGVVDFVGSDETATFGIDVLAFQGMYAGVGVGGRVELSITDLVERGLRIQGAFVGSFEQLQACVELCLAHGIRPLVKEYSLEDINQALADLREGRFLGRAVVHP